MFNSEREDAAFERAQALRHVPSSSEVQNFALEAKLGSCGSLERFALDLDAITHAVEKALNGHAEPRIPLVDPPVAKHSCRGFLTGSRRRQASQELALLLRIHLAKLFHRGPHPEYSIGDVPELRLRTLS